jgi:3'-phosphoadenosine 5'-phosphosulfate sulfotransferase
MNNASLVEKLSNLSVAYTDPLLLGAAKRLHAGEDAETVVVETFEQLAIECARLQQMRVEEAVSQGLPVQAPVRLVFPLGKEGAPPSSEIDKLLQTAQQREGKPLHEVWSEEKEG